MILSRNSGVGCILRPRIVSSAPQQNVADPSPRVLKTVMNSRLSRLPFLLIACVVSVGTHANTLAEEGHPNVVIGKPIYCCIPAKEWHHDETIEISHAKSCFVIYELDLPADKSAVGILDQFGLNRLQTNGKKWLCVAGSLLDL